MAGLLFLHGGPDLSREVYREEGRGYWSAALPVVLEKHGYLAFDTGGPELLADPSTWERYDCVIVGRLKPEAWSEEAVRRMVDSECPVFLEAPFPAIVRSALGVISATPTPGEGTVVPVDRQLAQAAAGFGYPGGGRLASPMVREIARNPAMDWSSLDGVPIEVDQARAWRARGWDGERWTVESGVQVLAEWTEDGGGDRSPAVIQSGRLYACSVGLLSALGQAHTSEPWYSGEYRSGHRSTGLEHLLLALIDRMHGDAGAPRMRILPWPRGGEWVLNVRHDFDRFLTPESVAQALEGHAQVGTAATWYWRSRHLRVGLHGRIRKGAPPAGGNEAARLVARAPRHEVAHHTERLWAGAEREQHDIERITGAPVRGTCAHGDPECFRFQGAPNLLWAQKQGLLYTEFIEHAHHLPHRCAVLTGTGEIEFLDVVCLPHHESLDQSTRSGDADVGRIAAAAQRFRETGGLLQVMNHPDINREELFGVLDTLPSGGRLDWTAARAASWWSDTHVRDRVRVESGEADTTRVTTATDVKDLVVEIRWPSGAVQRRLVDLSGDRTAMISTRTLEPTL